MPTLSLEHPALTLSFDDPTPLIDALEPLGRGFPFGCYMGHCAACMVQIIEGQEHLSAITPTERYTLTVEELGRGERLACQLTLLSGHVRLRTSY